MAKLGDYIDIKHGWPFKGEHFSDHGEQIVLTPANFYESGGFKTTPGKEKYYAAPYPPEYLCKAGDLIVVMTQQAEGLLGATARVPVNNVYLHNQRIGLITEKRDDIDLTFVDYLMRTPWVRHQLEGSSSGTKVKHTSPEKIGDVNVEIPPLETQIRIGNLLSSIDAKIANNKKLMTELDATARLIYDYWFTQFDFPDKNGNPYRSSGGKTVWSNVLKHDIPANWEIGSLEDIATLASGATPSTSEPSNYSIKGIAWITPDDLSGAMGGMFIGHGKRDVSLSGLQSCSATLLPKGSVILSSRAPIGYLAIALGNCCTNQGCKSFIPDKGYGSYFIFFMLGRMMPLIKSQGAGTTFKEVSKDTLSKLRVLLPPKPVVTLFEQTIEGICGEMRSLQAEAESLANLRDWLLPMLMNGQAQVTD